MKNYNVYHVFMELNENNEMVEQSKDLVGNVDIKNVSDSNEVLHTLFNKDLLSSNKNWIADGKPGTRDFCFSLEEIKTN